MTAQERRIITRAAEANPADWREVACAQEALKELLRKRKRIVQALPGQSRAAARGAKKAAHREATKAIREAVEARAGDQCEFCHDEFGTDFGSAPQLHHLLSGSGRRRQRQSVENTVKICTCCHNQFHEHPEAFRPTVLDWAARHDLPVPGRFA